jgi:hypothetical protein
MRNEFGVDEEFIVIPFSGRVGRGQVQCAAEFAMFSV